MQPTRDVSITYRMLGPRNVTLHMSIQASTGLTRVDNPSQQGYGIVDRQNQQDDHGDGRPACLHGIADHRRRATLAGIRSDRAVHAAMAPIRSPALSCTVWDYTSEHGSGNACITDDGVLLRSQDGANQHGMEATEVSYVPQPDADFRPPPDFVMQQLPTAGGGARRFRQPARRHRNKPTAAPPGPRAA